MSESVFAVESLLMTSAAATTGAGFTVNGPTLTALTLSTRFPLTVSTENLYFGVTAYNNYSVTATFPAGLVGVAEMEGWVQVAADGYVQARFSSEVSASAITAKAGSLVQYLRVN